MGGFIVTNIPLIVIYYLVCGVNRVRNFWAVFLDSCVMVASIYVSLVLRTSASGDEFLRFSAGLPMLIPIYLVVKVGIFYFFGIYRAIWKFFSAKDTIHLVKASLIATGVILALTFLAGDAVRLPRSTYLIDWAVSLIALFGIRLTTRHFNESKNSQSINKSGVRTLVYGAGQNGKVIAQRFSMDVSLNCNVVGFLDDDTAKVGKTAWGFQVLGTRKELEQIISAYAVKQLVIAIPSLGGDDLRELIGACGKFNIRPRIISKFTSGDEAGRRKVEIARMIELPDLLNRTRKESKPELIRKHFQGKRVLVTGAGGSIGSELSRQIFDFDPAQLVLLDHSEFNLFEIDHELKARNASVGRIVPALVNIKDYDFLAEVFKKYKPEIVIHAAAYKHVHLVEVSPYSSILNNIEGTRNLLKLSHEYDVQSFLLISSDKAVNPVGVMGATKRVCELMVTAYANANKKNYCSVRFGNVLGSSGSLIPTLQKQIAEGGPVTVTHPDMTRFFMLIPEAVSLVLTGCTLAKSGDINVLSMGEPVKIVDIAKNLIVLSGKTEEEIPISFIGLRPGEKMFEELYIRGDELRTEHPDILTLPWGDNALKFALRDTTHFWQTIDKLTETADDSNPQSLEILKELVSNNIAYSELTSSRQDS